MRFLYLTPMYGFDATLAHIAVPANAETALVDMAERIQGSDNLVAIYIPEGTAEVHEPGEARGRVVGAVKLTRMPPEKSIHDYFFDDWDGTRRWPIGWPVETVYAPAIEDCPTLRTIVEQVHGPNSFQPYVAHLQHGPIELDPKVAPRIESWFAQFTHLA